MDAWLSDLRTRANKLAVPAVVESQSLPGFISNDAGFFNKLMGQQSPTLNIDSMLTFLVKLWKTIGFYYLDREIGKKVILDVLDTIGMVSFNHLLMRKNFGTWKRGKLYYCYYDLSSYLY
jgi:myosin-5